MAPHVSMRRKNAERIAAQPAIAGRAARAFRPATLDDAHAIRRHRGATGGIDRRLEGERDTGRKGTRGALLRSWPHAVVAGSRRTVPLLGVERRLPFASTVICLRGYAHTTMTKSPPPLLRCQRSRLSIHASEAIRMRRCSTGSPTACPTARLSTVRRRSAGATSTSRRSKWNWSSTTTASCTARVATRPRTRYCRRLHW